MMKITAVQIEPSKLHKLLVGHFNLDELRTLCFDLQLDFEELPPGGKSAVARELVEYCQRRRLQVALAEAVLEHRPRISSNEFTRDISFSNAPFKGMLAFEEADEEIFFGREELTAELVTRVHSDEPTNFLAIVGASGSGKSSAVKAGMIPQLRRQTKWPIHLITPTAHPLQALATSLTRDSESVTATATLIDDLQQEPRALSLYAARMLQNNPAGRLLLVIDQFEELFTLCKDEAERTAFVENLVSAVAEDSQITILLTMRADFYAQCLKYEPLHRLLEQQQKIVPTMSSAELRVAIELPAQQANLTFDNGLVDILLRDVGAADNQTPEPGALPLLSHALLETWQRRDPAENRLTLAGYKEAGGVQGAIAKTAESTYQRLTADQQKIARSIFLRLTELGEGTQDTRRRAALAELLPQNDSRTTVEQVLKTLADARLLTTSNDGAEVAHEALIREWPTLQSWLKEDRDGLRLHRHLSEAAQAWVKNDRDESYLYRGGRLAQANDWVQTSNTELNELETGFLLVSQKQQHDELAKANARAEREAEAAQKLRQRAIFLRGALVLAAILAIIAFLMFGQSSRNARTATAAEETAVYNEQLAAMREAEANIQRQKALIQSLAAFSTVAYERDLNPELAILLSIEAARLNENNQVGANWLIDSSLRSILQEYAYSRETLTGNSGGIKSIAFSPDGKFVASGTSGGVVRLWNMDNRMAEPVVLFDGKYPVHSVAFSPDGKTLASGGGSAILLWNMDDIAAEPLILSGYSSSIWSVAFSPDGKALAGGYGNGAILIWDIKSPGARSMLLTGHEDTIYSVVFSPNGHMLASSSGDDTIRLWDLNNPTAQSVVLTGHADSVYTIAFSPDGQQLVPLFKNQQHDIMTT